VLVIAYNLCQNALLIPSVQIIEIDEMIGPLKATIDFKVKGNAVKQEVEKNQELVRSALRAVAALSKLADMGMYSILLDQYSDVKNTHAFSAAPTSRFIQFENEIKNGQYAEEYQNIWHDNENKEYRSDLMDLS
jgi:cullin-associated NEDD8-dissociated protein 1